MIAKNNLIFVIEQTIKKRTKQYLVKEIIVTFITTALTEWISRFFRYYSIFLREFERIPRKRGEAKILVAPTNESLNNSVYRNIADNVFFFCQIIVHDYLTPVVGFSRFASVPKSFAVPTNRLSNYSNPTTMGHKIWRNIR